MSQSCSALFFGSLREAAGVDKLDLIYEAPCSIDKLITQISGMIPDIDDKLRSHKTRILVDGVISNTDTLLDGRKEVAFLSPVSGG